MLNISMLNEFRLLTFEHVLETLEVVTTQHYLGNVCQVSRVRVRGCTCISVGGNLIKLGTCMYRSTHAKINTFPCFYFLDVCVDYN